MACTRYCIHGLYQRASTHAAGRNNWLLVRCCYVKSLWICIKYWRNHVMFEFQSSICIRTATFCVVLGDRRIYVYAMQCHVDAKSMFCFNLIFNYYTKTSNLAGDILLFNSITNYWKFCTLTLLYIYGNLQSPVYYDTILQFTYN